MPVPQRIPANIMGTSFRAGAGNLIMQMRGGQPLLLEREPTNRFDPNAIKVLVTNKKGQSFHLGYIGRQRASFLAPLMDNGLQVTCKKAPVTGAAIILEYVLPDEPPIVGAAFFNRTIELD